VVGAAEEEEIPLSCGPGSVPPIELCTPVMTAGAAAMVEVFTGLVFVADLGAAEEEAEEEEPVWEEASLSGPTVPSGRVTFA